MLIIYQIIGFIIIPLIKLNIQLRIFNKKEDKKRYKERYGLTNKKRPNGKLIWIHAASVGEFKSVSSLINKFYTKYSILVTTTTLTASNYAIKNFGNKIIHQYAPIDIKIWINRFLCNWKPTLVLWIESDLWPVTLHSIKKKAIKSYLINSRISPSSFNKWKFFKRFFTIITEVFEEIFAQSQNDKIRLEYLTRRKIKYIGNLKLAYTEKIKEKINVDTKYKLLKNYKIIMFASTHSGEELLFINFIKKILSKFDNVKIFIAPRHPQRTEKIESIFKNEKISTSTIDLSKKFQEDVIIINSLGKMSLYYFLSDFVVLGGSFLNLGGHNPIEPSINNCVVITGPHIYNWENVFVDMVNNNACLLCDNIKELEQIIIDDLIMDDNKMKLLKSKAKHFSNKSFYELEKLFSLIEKNLNK